MGSRCCSQPVPSPKPVRVFGNFGCSFISTAVSAISFDGVNGATAVTCTGHDTFGIYNQQGVAYYVLPPATVTPTTCTAPDGTAGIEYTLVFAEFVNTYNFSNDQVWGYSFNGYDCFSIAPHSPSFGGQIVYTIGADPADVPALGNLCTSRSI